MRFDPTNLIGGNVAMQFVRYGHSEEGESGYKILDSSPIVSTEVQEELLKLIQRLRFTVRDIGPDKGWFWRKFDNPRLIRVFGYATQNSAPQGNPKTIEIRLVLLTKQECELLDWQPFLLMEQIVDSPSWNPIEEDYFKLPEGGQAICVGSSKIPPQPPLLLWSEFASIMPEVLRRLIAQYPIEKRREIQFAAPKCGDSPLLVAFEIDAGDKFRKDNKSHASSNLLRAVVTGALLLGLLLAVVSLWNSNNEIHEKDMSIDSLQKQIVDMKKQQAGPLNEASYQEPGSEFKLLVETRQLIQGLLKTIHSGGKLVEPREVENLLRSIENASELRKLNKSLEIWLEEEKKIATRFERNDLLSKEIAHVATESKNLEKTIKRMKAVLKKNDDAKGDEFNELEEKILAVLKKVDESLEIVRQQVVE